MHKKCDYPDGTCQFHGAEVERRKSGDNGIRVMLGLLILIMGASFIYTTTIRSSSDTADSELRDQVLSLTKNMSTLTATTTILSKDVSEISSSVITLSDTVDKVSSPLSEKHANSLIQQLRYLNRNVTYLLPSPREVVQ